MRYHLVSGSVLGGTTHKQLCEMTRRDAINGRNLARDRVASDLGWDFAGEGFERFQGFSSTNLPIFGILSGT